MDIYEYAKTIKEEPPTLNKFKPIIHTKCPICHLLTLETDGYSIRCQSSAICPFGWGTLKTKKKMMSQKSAIWTSRVWE